MTDKRPVDPPPAARAQLDPVGPTAAPLGPFQAGPQTRAFQQVQVWQGQFPPPDAIERYEAVNPGTFDRLVTMAERQQQAVIEATAEARRFQRADNQRGQYLGALVAFLAILGAVFCAYEGQAWIAAALVGVPVLSVANALVNSARASVASAAPSQVPPKQDDPDEPSLPFT